MFWRIFVKKRKEKNFSLRLFAEKTGVSFSYLSSIESGQRQAPRYETLKKWLEY